MKTDPECIPCFLNQALKAMRIAGDFDSAKKERVLKRIMAKLANLDFELSPPEFALIVYKILEEELGGNGFYDKIKKSDSIFAESLIPIVKQIITESDYPLYELAKIAIQGNNMDFAIHTNYDIKKHIRENMKGELAVDDFELMRKDMLLAESIAYIVDNAGEAVLDRMLIEEMTRVCKARITVLVRSKPILNDVTTEDAKKIGFERIPNVKIERVDTVFPFIGKSEKIAEILKKSDLIISKGQANYECLSESEANIYFLLIAKCDVIARNIGVSKGSCILMNKKLKTNVVRQ
ncbi:MAG: ARMT1-like domain-containing protein [Candidatus Micrarchaeota archaeon]